MWREGKKETRKSYQKAKYKIECSFFFRELREGKPKLKENIVQLFVFVYFGRCCP